MAGNKRDRATWIRFSGVGFEFVAAVGGFAAVGYWIDLKFDSGPLWLLVAAALGLIGGTYNLIRRSMAAFAPPPGADEPEEKE